MNLKTLRKDIMGWHYDEISPITGNKSVVVSGKSKLCLESGYELFTGNDIVEFLNIAPGIIKQSQFIDDSGDVWFKTMRLSPDSVLIPVEAGWEVNSWRDLEIDSEITYEMMREVSTSFHSYKQVLDPATAAFYLNFLEAFDEFNKRANQEI